MKRCVVVALLLFTTGPAAFAQHDDHASSPAQQLGRRLYEQHCGVCHTRPTLVSGMYGPELNKDTAGGNQEVIRGVISDGTPRMPAFKYTFKPDDIAAIASYVVTLPVGHQTVTPPAR
jgi:mono/diheme cytochrome c family protein